MPLETFVTIKLGTLKNAAAICKAIRNAHVAMSKHTSRLLNNNAFTVATEKIEVDLVSASLDELGLNDKAQYSDICQKGRRLGLDLCPAEIGPQLRLQYMDQPEGEHLRIAMEPIANSPDNSCKFYFIVGHSDGGRFLNTGIDMPDAAPFGKYTRFVFLRRRIG